MLRKVLHSKIHMAYVTGAKPDYIGSITIDEDLLDACGMRANDAVEISNCRTGARFETYIFRGQRGSGVVELNGAAAHLVEVGDRLIIMHYGLMTDAEYRENRPRVLLMDEGNRILQIIRYEPTQAAAAHEAPGRITGVGAGRHAAQSVAPVGGRTREAAPSNAVQL